MSELLLKIYLMGCNAKKKAMDMIKSESGETNIIAIVLLIVIVIALAVIFRTQITNLVTRVWSRIFTDANTFT
ncbi:MAG: flagellin-like protein [Clostridiales bacterium]|nr:flagellin-like protein [Clostridiales bacterium]